MDWVKLFVESYVQFIGHIAWPVAIVSVLFIFRKPIVEKLRELTKAGTKDTFLEFAIPDLQEMVDKKKPELSEKRRDTLNWEDYVDALEQWALWLSVSFSQSVICYVQEPPLGPTVPFESLVEQINMVVQKIEKERPNSDYLPVISHFSRLSKRVLEVHGIKREICK